MTAPWPSPDDDGEPRLKAALAAALHLPADHLSITTGVRAGAAPILRAGTGLLLERPTFLGVRRLAHALGRPVTDVAWPDLTTLLSGSPGSDVVWVTSPCRNPDGAMLPAEVKRCLEDYASAGATVVQNLVNDWLAPRPEARIKGAALIGSLSKVAGGGVRLGWVADPRYAAWARAERRGATPPTPWQRTWARFVERGGLDILRTAVSTAVAESAAALDAALEEAGSAGVARPAETELLRLLPLGAGWTEEEACRRLLVRGFRVSPGAAFGAAQPSVRLSLTRLRPALAAPLACALTPVLSAP
ncbi:hypothetical protein [Streptomyces chartreusis]|uniref:hypothetical protein n=1 Tax=Streptomyces chartreusis TaxID=1969 RepID=UPI0033B573D3